ncbi:hypothetical protein JF544_01475 [Halobacillus kuroshimensis]|uniref:DUF4352 domain-containing protein n=1 Tax=Halobacillus kuroshimensis TaxID=302481 RepID=A0ABS3DRC7_9BACI|nr:MULTISPECIES: hypothetical protein [Halobacillus]MBN8233891.1 hypothetical protein [Halobacillus kuroshimensis]
MAVLLIGIVIIVAGCDDSIDVSESKKANSTQEQPASTERQERESDGYKMDTENWEMGSFDTVKKKVDIGEYQTGPISIDVKRVSLRKWNFNTEAYESLPEGEQQVLELFIKIATTDNEINFTDKNFHVTTDTGETFREAGKHLSSYLNGRYMFEAKTSRTLVYYLEGNLEEVNKVNFIIDAPTNENGESLGENKEFIVEF